MSYSDLASAVKALWSHYGRNLTREGQESWVRLLSQHDGPGLRAVFRSWTQTETSLPTTAGILARLHSRTANGPPQQYVQTPEEREKSQSAAVLSMLWLHYAKGWRLDSFEGTILATKFGCDPKEALQKAAEMYDRETILKWMRDRENAEPPATSKDYTDHIRMPKANATRSSWQDLDDIPDIG